MLNILLLVVPLHPYQHLIVEGFPAAKNASGNPSGAVRDSAVFIVPQSPCQYTFI